MQLSEWPFRKTIQAIGWISTAVSGVLLNISVNSTGYSISLYQEMPWFFYIFVFVPLVCSVWELVCGNRRPKLKFSGLVLFYFNIILILLLPLVLGYYLYGTGDLLRHLGIISQILETGQNPDNNFYPVTHVFGALLAVLLNVSVRHISYVIYTVLFTLHALSMFVLLRTYGINRRWVVCPFALLPVYGFFHTKIHPAFFSFLFLPLLLYAINNMSTSRWHVVLTVILIMISVSHPITFFGVVVLISSVTIVRLLDVSPDIDFINRSHLPHLVIALVVASVIFTTWYIRFGNIVRRGLFLVLSVVGFDSVEFFVPGSSTVSGSGAGRGSSSIPLIGIIQSAFTHQFTIPQIFRIGILRYGTTGLVYGLVPFAILYARSFGSFKQSKMKSLLTVMVASVVVSGILLSPMSPIGTPLRSLRWLSFASLLLVGGVLTSHPRFTRERTIRIMLCLVLVLSLPSIVFGVHLSPENGKANVETTEYTASGSEWVFEHEVKEREFVSSHASLRRMMQYQRYHISANRRHSPIPNHFGYATGEPICPTNECYLITTKKDRVFPYVYPPNVRETVNQYTQQDHEKLYSDSEVSRVYVNGEYEVYLSENSTS